ncbi:MAG TPA: glycine zipper 2TM domain-containing protein [Pseudorhodoferax sp.]|jgi:outer membrane lipoprotein SlyB|nr:glycine zipper 2TM domain-containing protein [Pseudorhodoferax sp.]
MQEHQASPTVVASKRSLWLAVGILSVAVAGLGGTLIGMHLPGGAPAAGEPPVAHGFVPFDGQPSQGAPTPAVAQTSKPAPAPVVRAPVAAPSPVVRAPATVCGDCGTVLSVNAVQRAAPASGVGVVAGGVVGGVLGNQVGGGTGRAVATVLGAVGGGWAGNEVEKRVRQNTHYVVRVRMDDGSIRTLEQGQALAVGTPVLVQGGVAQAHNRAVAVRG